MAHSVAFQSGEHAAAVQTLATFAHGIVWADLPSGVRDRVSLMLGDLLGVTVAGMRTPELRSLLTTWHCPPGDAPLPGSDLRTTPDTAAYLSAVAACALELDEGNKYAAGHPAAHVVFAALAAIRESDRPVPGREFLTAVALGYETGARFGRATKRDPRWHTHGHWGATGAACAAALLLGGSPTQVAAAVDSATGLMHVSPWRTVLAGDFTRNLWIAGANQAGLHASRLALAGLVRNRGACAYSLGDLVGTLDHQDLVADLGQRWLLTGGYLKQHSSCSYTHGAVDLVQALRNTGEWEPQDVAEVRVRIHSLAHPLFGRHPENRLAAMFSLPFVVSTAVVSGRVDPDTMEPGTRPFDAAEVFSERVQVAVDERLDRYLPDQRCTEVTVVLYDGSTLSLAQANPIGDADHFPLGRDEVRAKLSSLLGTPHADKILEAVRHVAESRSVATVLDELG